MNIFLGKTTSCNVLGNVHLFVPCYFTVLRTEYFNIQYRAFTFYISFARIQSKEFSFQKERGILVQFKHKHSIKTFTDMKGASQLNV
jgi:hypothetical protein